MGQRRTKKYLQALAIARQIPKLQHSTDSLSRTKLYRALFQQGYYWNKIVWYKPEPKQRQPKA